MRVSLRAWLGMTLAVSTGVGLLVACSGSDDTPVTPTADAAPEATVDTGVQDTSRPDTGPADAARDTGPQYDAGPPITLDSGIPCVQGGIEEMEPNDDKNSANAFDNNADAGPSASVCGVVSEGATAVDGGDAGDDGGDAGGVVGSTSDFLTFQLQATTRSFYLQFSGDITMTVEVEGNAPVVISPTSSPALPFVKDKPYYIEVKSRTGRETNWRVSLFETK